ncbi:MAG: hypothetical protein ACK4J0_01105 [Candidatus Anstonellaceae archaeon]
MGLDDFLISTGVDNLIKLVQERKRIETKEAAMILRLPFSIVQDWAKTLEEEKIIKIEYSLTKEYLVWSGIGKEEYKEKKIQIEQKRREVVKKIEGMKKIVDENVAQLAKLEEEFRVLEKKTNNSLQLLAGDLHEVEILTAKIDQQLLEKKQVMQTMYSEIKKTSSNLIEIKKIIEEQIPLDEKKSNELLKRMDDFSVQIEKKISKINDAFEQINKLFALYTQQKEKEDFSEKLKNLEKEIAELKYTKKEMLKVAKSVLLEAQEIDQKTKEIETKIEEIKKEKEEEMPLEEIKEKIESLYVQIIEESKEISLPLQTEYKNMKTTISEYSNLLYNYREIVNKLESIEDKYQKEAAELTKIIDMIEDARRKYLKDLEDAKNSLGENRKQYQQLLEKSKRIELILSNVNELKQEGEKLSKKLKGIVMETEIVDIAAPKETGSIKNKISIDSGYNEKPEEYLPFDLVKKIELTQKEEKEFEKKREELTYLITKLLKEEEET